MRNLKFESSPTVVAKITTELGKFEICFNDLKFPFHVVRIKPDGNVGILGNYRTLDSAKNAIGELHEAEVLFTSDDGIDILVGETYHVVHLFEHRYMGGYIASNVNNIHNTKNLYARFADRNLAEAFCSYIKTEVTVKLSWSCIHDEFCCGTNKLIELFIKRNKS